MDIVIIILLFLANLTEFTFARLLQLNRVYTSPFTENDTLKIDISLFRTCPSFTIVFTTENFDSTRVLFAYSNETLLKADVDSPQLIPSPEAPLFKCAQKERKPLLITLSIISGHYRIESGEQMFLRQRSDKEEKIKIFIPHQKPCCLIRAILYEEGPSYTLAPPFLAAKFPFIGKTIVQPQKFKPKPEEEDRFAKVELEQSENTTVEYIHPTPPTYDGEGAEDMEIKYSLYSWTRKINERWINSFFVFCGVMTAVLVGFTCFGLIMFICLQGTPKLEEDTDDCATARSVVSSIVSTSRLRV